MKPYEQTLFAMIRDGFDMHPRSIGMLLCISRARKPSERTVGFVLEYLKLPTAAASRHGGALEDDGYVVRSISKEDRRAIVYSLTQEGEALVKRIAAGFPTRKIHRAARITKAVTLAAIAAASLAIGTIGYDHALQGRGIGAVPTLARARA